MSLSHAAASTVSCTTVSLRNNSKKTEHEMCSVFRSHFLSMNSVDICHAVRIIETTVNESNGTAIGVVNTHGVSAKSKTSRSLLRPPTLFFVLSNIFFAVR